MFLRILLTSLVLAVVPVQSFAAQKCGSFPLPDEGASKEERIRALFQRGADCIRQGKPNQTIATFSEVIGLDPENVDAYSNRGSAYIQSGQIELGLADFSHIIRIKPQFVQAWYNRGTAFITIKQFDPDDKPFAGGHPGRGRVPRMVEGEWARLFRECCRPGQRWRSLGHGYPGKGQQA